MEEEAMADEKRIALAIDDDMDILFVLQEFLEMQGYQAITATEGIKALNLVLEIRPSLVLLDINLPNMNGFEVCKNIRKISSVPIIMVSGAFLSEEDKITGLDAGADDYITKPIKYNELSARIRAVLRRTSFSENHLHQTSFQCQDLKIDLLRQIVTIGEERVNLTATEFRIISCLAFQAGKVITPQELFKEIWGEAGETDFDVLRVNISRMRKKLHDTEIQAKYINTIPGQGYLLDGKYY
jgi:DNA-binding response OmpR family regulator